MFNRNKMNIAVMVLVINSLLIMGNLNAGSKNNRKKGIYNSYRGLVMAGYQGWFNTAEDGANKDWKHYNSELKDEKNGFYPGRCSIDFWPDMTEYKKKYATPFKFADGSTAYIFSSYDYSTVDLHFKWMKEYGIDGAFMQRFLCEMHKANYKNHMHVVFDHAMKASKKYGRAISIRYDLTGTKKGYAKILLKDLDEIIKRHDLLNRKKNPTFLYHNGKPLVAFGGVGFKDRIAGEDDVGYLNESMDIIKGLKKRGFSIMVRVPSHWRTYKGGLMVKTKELRAQFLRVLMACDVIMPWQVGSFRERSFKGRWARRIIPDDIKWCEEKNKDYAPVLWLGFSRANLKGGEDGSFRPRNKGAFFWLQTWNTIKSGGKMIFLAQFDEVDEGTQFFKCAQEVPVGKSPFIKYDKDIGTDHYLWLAGEAGRMLRKERPFTTKLPERKNNRKK